MATSSICPWCSYALLSQVKHGKQQLYCFHCHEEIPAGIAQLSPPQDSSRVNRYSRFSSTDFSNSVMAANLIPSHQSARTETLMTLSGERKASPAQESKIKSTTHQSVKKLINQPINQLPDQLVSQSNDEDILLDYVAHFISRGKVVVSNISGKVIYKGRVYQSIGYVPEFHEFWLNLRSRRDFEQLYLEGDVYCFGQFLNGSFEVGECVRCDLQIPIPLGMHQYQGSCHLCDKHPTINRINLLIVGDLPTNPSLLQKLFALRGFKVSFIDRPQGITEDILGMGIGLILLYGEVSERLGHLWLELLHHYTPFQYLPIVALSRQAGRRGRNSTIELEDYLQQALNAESLTSSLRYLIQQHKQLPSGLHWLPR
jgi:hypothetical protein